MLIPFSVVLVLAFVALFGWALHSGQFDDVEREGARFLLEDSPDLDLVQGGTRAALEQSAQPSAERSNHP